MLYPYAVIDIFTVIDNLHTIEHIARVVPHIHRVKNIFAITDHGAR